MTRSSYVINTERFTLEPLTQAEARLLAELGADPDVVKPLICDWSTPAKRLEIAKYQEGECTCVREMRIPIVFRASFFFENLK